MFDPLFEGMATVLAFFYDLTKSYGFAIVLLTILVRTLVMPLTLKSTRSMMAMQKYQPEIKRIQTEFKDDREQLNTELLAFYRENNINPIGACLPILIQAPAFILLWQVVQGITRRGEGLVFDPKFLDAESALDVALRGATKMQFIGIDLSRSALTVLGDDGFVPSLPYLAIIAIVTATSYYQQRQVQNRNPDVSAANQMQMRIMKALPLVFGVFSFQFEAALGIYLVTSNLFQVAQQSYITRSLYGIKRGQTPPPSGAEAGTPKSSGPKKPSGEPASTSSGQKTTKSSGPGRTTNSPGRTGSGRVTPKKGEENTPTRRPGTMPPRRIAPGSTSDTRTDASSPDKPARRRRK